MKVAVFQITNNGSDGRAPTEITFSSTCEINRNNEFKSLGKNQSYYNKNDTVLDLSKLGQTLVNKLDGNDKMILNMCLGFDFESDSLQAAYHDINVTCYTPKKN